MQNCERMYKIKMGSQSIIHDNLDAALEELKTLLSETDDLITVEAVNMTEEEFSKLEESDGW